MRPERSYLLKLWNDGEAEATWRARIEDLATRRTLHFASFDALARYLESGLRPAPGEGGSGNR